MILFRKLLTLFGFSIFFSTLFAKGTLTGIISDSTTGEKLLGVNIETKGIGTSSDIDGKYILELDEGSYLVTFSYLGYTSISQNIDIKDGQTQELNILLQTVATDLSDNEVVITGSMFEKRASEEVISIELIKPKALQNLNPVRLDEIARITPGLNVVDGQTNIRAGSGWTYGVGSRVMFILDGMPVLSPDRGDVKWTLLPVELAGQIEVLKGASSVLYGSSAMNGTINILYPKPTSKPITRISVYQSFITSPKNKVYKWWKFPIPTFGVSFMRAHKPKPNYDYIVGSNIYISNNHFERGQEFLARFNFKTRWINKKNENMSYGIGGSMMYNKEYEFFYWQNKTDGAYKAGADNDFQNIRLTVDPFFQTYDKKNNKHEIRGRLYFNRPSFSTITILQDTRYSFNKRYESKKFNIVAGAEHQYLWVKVPAFAGGGSKMANLLAGFTQLDKKYKKLTLTAGVRFEMFKYEKNIGVTGSIWKNANGKTKFYLPGQWRCGLNYEISKNSFLRFNIGQAYRFASFAEQFVNENVGSASQTYSVKLYDTIPPYIYVRDSSYTISHPLLHIHPNTDLTPEYGFTSEIGFEQKWNVRKGKYTGNFDIAFFWQEYKNMIDINTIGPVTNAEVNLQFQNISKARIAGYEINWKNNIKIAPKHNMYMNVGYTYSMPVDLNQNAYVDVKNPFKYLGFLFKNMFKTMKIDDAYATTLLKYRNRSLLTFDMEYNFNDQITIGADLRYYSSIENFDVIFLNLNQINEYYVDNYYNTSRKGDAVLNVRAFYTYKKRHNFGLVIKNITNTEFWLRPGKLEQPRSVGVQYRLEF